MQVYQVQLWPGGKWDGKPFQKIEANSEKEAAEKLCGHALVERGATYQIRARVKPLTRLQGVATVFYVAPEVDITQRSTGRS